MIIGELLALFTAFCWAQNSVFYSITGKRVSSSTTAHIRLWITLPFMLLIHFLFYKTFFPFNEPLKAYIYISLSGFFGYFFADLMIFKSFVDLGPRETTVILTLTPIFSSILSYFIFSQSLTLLKIAGIAVTITGIITVIIGDSPEYKFYLKKRTINNNLKNINNLNNSQYLNNKNFKKDKNNKIDNNYKINSSNYKTNSLQSLKIQPSPLKSIFKINKGIIIALLGAIGQALGLVLAKMGQNLGTSPISTNTIRVVSALFAYIIYRLIIKNFKNDFKKMKDRKSFLYITIAAIVGPIFGVIAALYAINYAPVGIVSTIMQIVPILLLPYEYFILKKKITFLSVSGTIVAVIGTALLFM